MEPLQGCGCILLTSYSRFQSESGRTEVLVCRKTSGAKPDVITPHVPFPSAHLHAADNRPLRLILTFVNFSTSEPRQLLLSLSPSLT